jgi:hypothetical protein
MENPKTGLWFRAFSWLICKLRLYLTGFQESRIRPESRKITQKVAGKKHGDSAFTLFIFTIIVVDFPLHTVRTGVRNY